jgi:hypothetical protein
LDLLFLGVCKPLKSGEYFEAFFLSLRYLLGKISSSIQCSRVMKKEARRRYIRGRQAPLASDRARQAGRGARRSAAASAKPQNRNNEREAVTTSEAAPRRSQRGEDRRKSDWKK